MPKNLPVFSIIPIILNQDSVYIPIPCNNGVAVICTEAIFSLFTNQVTICGYMLKTDMVSTWRKLYLKPCLSSRKQILLFITPGKFCDVSPDSIQQESKTLVCLNAIITVF